MISEEKSHKPVELSSIINVIQRNTKPSHRSPYNKMELKSVVHVGNDSRKRSNSNGVKGHHHDHRKNPKASKSIPEKPILLLPFRHQVSGRASMLCYDETTILKPYVSRELYFYLTMPQELKKFTPQFRGLITVSFIEDSVTASVLAYALPQTLVKPNAKSIIKLFAEEPKPHSKRCVKDFGKTHVIYPDYPSEQNTSFDQDDEDESMFIEPVNYDPVVSEVQQDDEVMSELSQGFDVTVCIDDTKATEKENKQQQKLSTSGMHNPWNTKVLDDAWLKLKLTETDDPTCGKKKKFSLLENVVAHYRYPCVLDLKIGTRIRENASTEKIARHVTAINLGARLSGMQIYHPDEERFTYHNKYYGHNLTISGFKSNLRHFFSRGIYPITESSKNQCSPTEMKYIDRNLVKQTIKKLKRLKDIVTLMKSRRFYSSSLLILYEGDVPLRDSESDCDIDCSQEDCVSTESEKSQNNGSSSTKASSRSFSFSEFLQRLKQSHNKYGKRAQENPPSQDTKNEQQDDQQSHRSSHDTCTRDSTVYKQDKRRDEKSNNNSRRERKSDQSMSTDGLHKSRRSYHKNYREKNRYDSSHDRSHERSHRDSSKSESRRFSPESREKGYFDSANSRSRDRKSSCKTSEEHPANRDRSHSGSQSRKDKSRTEKQHSPSHRTSKSNSCKSHPYSSCYNNDCDGKPHSRSDYDSFDCDRQHSFFSKSWPPRTKSSLRYNSCKYCEEAAVKERCENAIEYCDVIMDDYDRTCFYDDNSSYEDLPSKGSSDAIDVRMIDFAHYCFQDGSMHPGPDSGFIFGLENLINLLNEMLKL